MLWELIDKLSARNGFTPYHDDISLKKQRGAENTFLYTEQGRQHYVDMFTKENMTRPYSYVKHLNFLDFTEFNENQPIFINFVRDPVERVVSWYYYIRAPWYIVRRDNERNRTEVC